jgi:hypothetical protein
MPCGDQVRDEQHPKEKKLFVGGNILQAKHLILFLKFSFRIDLRKIAQDEVQKDFGRMNFYPHRHTFISLVHYIQ